MKSPSYMMNDSNGSLKNDFKNKKNMNNYYDTPTINSPNSHGGDYELGSPLTNGSDISTSTFRSAPTEARDPITRLQNRDMLSRRASKRFSAYQSQKMISKSSPLMEDPSQNRFSSPKFNRVTKAPNSPLQEEVSRNIRESESQRQAMNNVSNEIKRSNSISIKVPDISITTKNSNMSISGNGSHLEEDYFTHDTDVIYLKLANRIKKVDVKLPLTIQQLQILFLQKFSYSPSDEKNDSFPPIYIQDSGSSISYELEDMNDVKPGVVLTLLNTTDNEKLMKNMELQIDTLKSSMSKMEETLMENLKQISSSIIDSVQSAQTAQTAEVAKVAAAAAATAAAAAKPSSNNSDESKATSSSKAVTTEKETSKATANTHNSNLDAAALKKEVEEIRHELVKARQHSSDIKKNANEKIADALKLISQFQSLSTSSNSIISNPYMENCKKQVSEECEELK
ncbi:unnamed protein product [[Candida] boidinii]|nr:unnamed protein product [[Candida] boidinii]